MASDSAVLVVPRNATVGWWLFPAILAATLLQNYYDIDAILSGEALALYTYDGPIIFKLGKDLIYLLLLALIARHAIVQRRSPLRDYAWAIFFIVAVLFVVSAALNGPVIAIIGLRWALPFLLFFLLRDWVGDLDPVVASRWLVLGMVLCLGAQIYQIFNMPPVFGEILPGIPARTPGIFIAPNSAAFFACASAACIMVFRPNDTRTRAIAIGGAVAISAMAQSGTGLVVAFTLTLRWLSGRQSVLFWPVAIVAFVAMIANLESLTQRGGDYVELSGGGRLAVLASVADRAAFSVANFGVFTNAANLRSDNPEDQVAVDSLVASWVGNFGLMSLFVAVLLALYVAYRMREVDWFRAFPSVIVFLLFSLTSIVFEAFPMNLYIAVGIWAAQRAQEPLRMTTRTTP